MAPGRQEMIKAMDMRRCQRRFFQRKATSFKIGCGSNCKANPAAHATSPTCDARLAILWPAARFAKLQLPSLKTRVRQVSEAAQSFHSIPNDLTFEHHSLDTTWCTRARDTQGPQGVSDPLATNSDCHILSPQNPLQSSQCASDNMQGGPMLIHRLGAKI